jgi:hypothetical protein
VGHVRCLLFIGRAECDSQVVGPLERFWRQLVGRGRDGDEQKRAKELKRERKQRKRLR